MTQRRREPMLTYAVTISPELKQHVLSLRRGDEAFDDVVRRMIGMEPRAIKRKKAER